MPIAGLCATRAMVGLGEGIAPSAATDMVARVIAKVPPALRETPYVLAIVMRSQVKHQLHCTIVIET